MIAESPNCCPGIHPHRKAGTHRPFSLGDRVECLVGIDVSKAALDIASLPDAETWTVTKHEAGLAELLPRQVRSASL